MSGSTNNNPTVAGAQPSTTTTAFNPSDYRALAREHPHLFKLMQRWIATCDAEVKQQEVHDSYKNMKVDNPWAERDLGEKVNQFMAHSTQRLRDIKEEKKGVEEEITEFARGLGKGEED